MVERNETRVRYRAIADFTALARAARSAKREIAQIEAQEKKTNAASVRGAAQVAAARKKRAEATRTETRALDAQTRGLDRFAAAMDRAGAAQRKRNIATRDGARATQAQVAANRTETESVAAIDRALSRLIQQKASEHAATRRATQSTRQNSNENRRAASSATTLNRSINSVHRGLVRLGQFRLRLTPSFVSLIPILGGLLGVINPLVAGFGAAGAAALAFGGQISSLGGIALGVIPGLAALFSVVGALRAAFGGVGEVFKQYGAMKKAAGGGGGGGGGGSAAAARAELTRTERLARAQERLRRATEDVTFAQEDLDEARKDYIRRLNEMRRAVDRTSLSEARAAANSQLAREAYFNAMADPSSTRGDKMDAITALQEAEEEQKDVLRENRENAAELARLQATGVEGDRDVVMARRAVTDSLWAVRDAELEVINSTKETNAAAGSAGAAAAGFANALDKLSPSARRFVENLLSMEERWESLKRNVQERFFQNVADDILLLNRLFPVTEKLLGNAADASGRVARNFLRMITSDKWLADLDIVANQNVPIIENVGAGLLEILDAILDLTVAVGPFAEKLSESFLAVSTGFGDVVADARESGSLASWLDKVYLRMQQWWRIIKNIGSTLFNYSSAAENFGNWLMDGFEGITEGWKKSSEEAVKEGSGFQTYLENIKPLLSEMQDLLGTFFHWLGEEMSDPENIELMTGLLRTLREDIGPALASILDTLAEAEISQHLLDALTAILEFVAGLLENGGAEGLKAFTDVVKDFFDGLSEIVDATPQPVLTAIVTAFTALAALRFLGLTTLIGNLLSLITNPKTLTTLKGLVGLGGAAGAGSAASGAGGAAAAGGAAGAAGKGGGFKGFLGASAAGGGIGLAIGGTIAAIANFAQQVPSMVEAIKTINNPKASGKDKVGAALGGARSALDALPQNVGINAVADIVGIFSDEGARGIRNWWSGQKDAVMKAGESGARGFGETARKVGEFFRGESSGIGKKFKDESTGINSKFKGESEGIRTRFQSEAGGINSRFKDEAGGIGGRFKGEANGLGGRFQGEANGIGGRFKGEAGGIGGRFQSEANGIGGRFKGEAGGIGGRFYSEANGIGSRFQSEASGISRAFSWAWNIGSTIASSVSRAFSGAKNFLGNLFGASTGGLVPQYLSGGGTVYRAGSGRKGDPFFKPRGTDTVPSMLTPNEFVVRAPIVKQVGVDNLERLNAGSQTFAQMLASAASTRRGASNATKQKDTGGGFGGMSFFDGGGLVQRPNYAPQPQMATAGGAPAAPAPVETSGGDTYNITVNNPRPETTSDSIPRSIRKVGYVRPQNPVRKVTRRP